MELLDRLKAGKKNRKTIKFPGTDHDVVIRILSESEHQEAHFETERLFRQQAIEVSMATVDIYESEKTTQILYRALRNPAGDTPIAKSVAAFRTLIERQEKDALAEEYMSIEKESSLNVEDLTEDDIDELIDELKKRPDSVGNISSIAAARRLISSLVSRLQTSQKDNGSTLP